MKKPILILGIILVALAMNMACSRVSKTEQKLRENLNKQVKLDMFDSVRRGDVKISYTEFRNTNRYISVVYLKDGCKPCYPKFINWQHKMDSLATPRDYTILFIIQGSSYRVFMEKVHAIDSTMHDHYYTIMDSNYKFEDNNSIIPKWLIEDYMLIDGENKIKMIGEPWSTPAMTNLFHKVCI